MASIKRQLKTEMWKKKAFGESKRKLQNKAIEENKNKDFYTKDKIFSQSTFKNYYTNNLRFLQYVQNKHPEVKTIEEAQVYVKEYMDDCKERGLSAWTQQAYMMAINKLYGSEASDYGISLERRSTGNITQNRGKEDKRQRFSELKYQKEINFCKHTGLRRREVLATTGKDYIKKGDDYYIQVHNGKGGKYREAKIIGEPAEVAQIIDYMDSKGDKPLFDYITPELPIHAYRREYAWDYYHLEARSLDSLNSKDIIKSRKGWFDRSACLEVSRSLGHNRENVVYQHYL